MSSLLSLRIRPQPALGRKHGPPVALLGPAPQPLLEEDRDDDRHQSQAEQVPGAVVAEELVERPENDGADDRTFDAADAADDDHEDPERGPVDAEGGVRADAQVAEKVQRAVQRPAD